MLPDVDGFELHRRLAGASSPRLPVVFLTARRETDDRIRGLTIGADDYVVKPFSLEELIARIRAVLRRTSGESQAPRALVYEDLELDEDSREVRRGGRLVELTPTAHCATSWSTASTRSWSTPGAPCSRTSGRRTLGGRTARAAGPAPRSTCRPTRSPRSAGRREGS
jgi:response regulator RpfG family c-di-GMP phosphodiesterase